jgi:cell division protein FtsL
LVFLPIAYQMFSRPRIPKRVTAPRIIPMSGVFIALGIVLLLGISALLIWNFFPSDAAQEGSQLRQQIEVQEQQIAELREERSQLRQKVAELERRNQIDEEAVSRAREELKSFQTERLKLEEELAFLRGIMSTGSGKQGLRIHDLRLNRIGSDNLFRFRFTVSNVQKNTGVTRGKIWVTLEGNQDGKVSTLPLEAVTAEKVESLKMRFRYFQKVDGQIQLPEGFKPSAVSVEVRPVSRGQKPIKQRFDWRISG